jgi:hypothetical protein
MQRIVQLSMLCLAASVVSACNPEQVIKTDPPHVAGVRFINAVPDSAGAFGLDFRFIDIVESNAQFKVTFRNSPPSSGIQVSTGIEYKSAKAGSRHFRIFLDDTLQAIASTVVKDSTITLEENHNYTVLLMGSARSTGADKMRLVVIDETVGDPGAQVALRVINATGSAIDAREYVQGGTAPAAATWANVPPFGISTYVNVAAGNVMYNVQPAGGGTALFTDLQAPPGTAAGRSCGCTTGNLDLDAIPGTTVAGSAVTLIVFPRSTAGAKTPQTSAFAVPGGSFMWDRRPPRPAGV